MDIKARMPGTITKLNVAVGDTVKARQVVATMEAMKMEQPVPAPKDGTVSAIAVAVGDKLKSGGVIMTID